MAGAPSPSPDEVLEIGSVLDGRYRIDGLIGGGGMARVYRATHLGIGRFVAIKVLRADLSRTPEAAVRFQREAITSGRLEHPNIVAVTDSGTLPDGRCFLVMESLDGETLAERLAREGRLPWRVAVALVRGIVVGLRHAHDHGVIHRDIKPDNLFVMRRDEEPLVKILDFGIAKLHEHAGDDGRITQQGLTIGSPIYMSPEQAVDGEITPASDLYSTTVVLFEMLTGATPFDRRNPVATMKAHVSTAPPTLREVAPEIDLPPGLEEVVQAGLAKGVADRVRSADKLLGMLDRVRDAAATGHVRGSRPASDVSLLRGEPDRPAAARSGRGSARNVEPTQMVRVRRRPWRRSWVIAGSTVVTLVVAVIVVLAVRSPASSGDPPAAPEPIAKLTAVPAAAAGSGDVDESEIEMDGDEPGDATAGSAAGANPGSGRGVPTQDRRRELAQVRAWIKAGNVALAAGKFDDASASFQRALAVNHNAHAALAGLAEVAFNRADFSSAVLSAKRAVALAPSKVAYRMTLAKAYYKIMRYDDAIQQWQKVLDRDPTNATVTKNIEMARSKLGR